MFNRKPQHDGGGGDFGPIYQKSAFETVQVLQSILDIQTYIYIYIYYNCVSIVYEPFSLGRFATDHSLTKVTWRPFFFVCVRRFAAPQRDLLIQFI